MRPDGGWSVNSLVWPAWPALRRARKQELRGFSVTTSVIPQDVEHDIRRLIEALSEPSAYPRPVATVRFRQTHISVVFRGLARLQDQEAGGLGVRELQHVGTASPLLRGRGPLESPPGARGLSWGRPSVPASRRDPNGEHRRGHRMGGEDEAAPRLRDAPRPVDGRRPRSRGTGGIGSPARPFPCRGPVRRRDRRWRVLEAIARNARENLDESGARSA
jgi:hypothetical protein